MRVVIASRIYLPEPSAASFFLGSVADELSRRGHEVVVLTAKPPRNLSIPSRTETIRTFPAFRDRNGYIRGYIPYLSFDIPLFFRLLFMRRAAAVLVEPPPTTGAIVRLVCKLRRIPYTYDAADLWSVAAVHATNSHAVLKVLKALERWAINGAASIVTISDGVRERLRSWGIRKPVQVTGYGADTTQFHYRPTETKPEFIYAGTYTHLHGAILLVDAFAEFRASAPLHKAFRLRFIGLGTEQPAMLERARALGLEGKITFEPPLPPKALSLEFSAATASLATLLPGGGYEFAFATKTYSSLASGCPVIFAGPGPTSEFIQDTNRQVAAGSATPYAASSIANAMSKLAANPLTTIQRTALSQWAHTNVSMRKTASDVADVIERNAD